jgi:hypothetical protein
MLIPGFLRNRPEIDLGPENWDKPSWKPRKRRESTGQNEMIAEKFMAGSAGIDRAVRGM